LLSQVDLSERNWQNLEYPFVERDPVAVDSQVSLPLFRAKIYSIIPFHSLVKVFPVSRSAMFHRWS
jgi:hypothetical protein